MKKVTLTGSLIRAKDKQIATARSLGLRKIGDCAVCADDEVLAGKLRVISHLVNVEEA